MGTVVAENSKPHARQKMIRSLALPTLAVIGALCLASFGTSCTTVATEDQSEFIKKVRESDSPGKIKPRHQRRSR